MRLLPSLAAVLLLAHAAAAQTPAPAAAEPPPVWDAEIGASFVGTSGNSSTSSFGADFSAHNRGPVWQLETSATAVRASSDGLQTAQRYVGGFRSERGLTPLLKFSAGEHAERDRLAGIAFRNILDAGLGYTILKRPAWTVDGTTSLAWNHENWIAGPNRDDPIALLQVLSRLPLGGAGDTTQRFTFYPDLRHGSAYRSEAEVTAQAAMNAHLALKLGYLWRYSNAPVPGFLKGDNTATASVVLHWRSVETVAAAP